MDYLWWLRLKTGNYLTCFLLMGGICLLLNVLNLKTNFISKSVSLSRVIQQYKYELQPKVVLPHTITSTSSIANLTTPQKDKVNVAICSGITSKPFTTMPDKATMHSAFPMFQYFMQSFCQTYSNGYSYHFYLAYDFNDIVFNNATGRSTFTSLFYNAVNSLCLLTDSDIQLVWKECDHSGKPAWAQNDAVMEAYLDGMDYFYRVNDDTRFETTAWTETFIAVLQEFNPPNIGVVGPNLLRKLNFLTYDFTHKFHQDIFGFHYPRIFRDWGADVWITKIYQPGRSTKIRKVIIRHTMFNGTRYKIHVMKQIVPSIVESCMPILDRYLDYALNDKPAVNESYVIAYSLHGNDLDELNGALRNVQLAPIVYPGWRIRIYTPVQTSSHAVPQRYITKYESLGAQVLRVTLSSVSSLLHLYVDAFIDPDVSVLLIRDARHRLDERQKHAVNDWLMEEKSTLHCMRDHPMHTGLVHGLLGFRLNKINKTTRKRLRKQDDSESFMWTTFQDDVMCHDWTSTSIGEHKKPFPTKKENDSYVGELYDAYMTPVSGI